MNLQALVAVAEIVSALAVTFTLIALIISLRQNTRSQKALVVDSLAAAIASINVPAMESQVLGSAISKATANRMSQPSISIPAREMQGRTRSKKRDPDNNRAVQYERCLQLRMHSGAAG